jgi:hypothetical protein
MLAVFSKVGMREGPSIAEAVAVAMQPLSLRQQLPTECIFYFGGPE